MFLYANGRQFILYFSFKLGLEETSGGDFAHRIYVLYQHKRTKKVIPPLEQKCETEKLIIPTGGG